MNELVERCAARAGTDAAVACVTVGTIPDFQRQEGPAGKVQSLIGTRTGRDNTTERARSLPARRSLAFSPQAPSYS